MTVRYKGWRWEMEVYCRKVVLYYEVVQYYLKVDSTKLKINIALSRDMTEKNP